MNSQPLTITVLHPPELTELMIRRLEAAWPGVVVQSVPYLESPALRTARAAGDASASLRATAPALTADQWAAISRSDALVALDIPEQLVEQSPRLRWLQTFGAGTDHMDLPSLSNHGVTVTNSTGVGADGIAEFTIARLIAVWKRFRLIDEMQSRREWNYTHGAAVRGKTLGVIGFGSIGRGVATRARGFGVHVLAVRRSPGPEGDPDADELFASTDIDAVIPRCDAVILAAPATSETFHMIDRRRISLMKPGALLCNVARGTLVDEDAVVAALVSGHLGAAVLDVTTVEPTPESSALWTAPNCYLSFHSAVVLDGYPDAVIELAAENLERLRQRLTLRNVVVSS